MSSVQKQTEWIEVLGCGMVDPNVFEFVKNNGYDPKKVSGASRLAWAWTGWRC